MGTFEQIVSLDDSARKLRDDGDRLRAARRHLEAVGIARELARPRLAAVLWQRIGQDLSALADRLQDSLHAFEFGLGALDGDPETDIAALMQRLQRHGKIFEPLDGDPLPAAPADAASSAALLEAEKDPTLLLRLLIDAGNGYLAMRQESIALERYEAALAQPEIDAHLKARALVNKALAQRALGKLDDAEATLREALPLTATDEETYALAALASLHMARADRLHSDARDLYMRAAEHAGDRQHEARVRIALGLLHLEQGRYDEAGDAYRRALELEPRERWAALWGLGSVARAHGQLDEAARLLSEAVALVEREGAALRTDEGKVSFLESAAQAFDQLLSVELDRAAAWKASFEPALAAAERARGRAIADLALMWRRWRPSGAASPVAQMALGIPSGDFGDDLFAPSATSAQGGEREAAAPLSRLVFHVLGDVTATFLATRDGGVRGHVAKLGRNEIATLVGEARRALGVTDKLRSARPAADERPPSDSFDALRRLYDELVAPLIDGVPKGETLVLEPHGPLWLLPFAALPDERRRWLGQRFPLVLAPSAATLADIRSEPHQPLRKPRAVLLGNPKMPDNLRIGDREVVLDELPGAEEEARALAKLFDDSKLLIGADATLAALTDGLEERDVVHLATHGFALESDPLASGVVLAPEPSLLTAREVHNLRVNADLVVLSACQTGLGRLTGDGVIGLLRSFLAAGARAVLASLWSVSDEATARLMTGFYRRYLAGDDKATALSKACTALAHDFPHPFYWAPFVLAGAPERGRRRADFDTSRRFAAAV